MCAYTCQMHPNDCKGITQNVELLAGEQETKTPAGECSVPVVANGEILNTIPILSGDRLVIQCASGFVLSGAENYCIIQSIYGPDSRILQLCIPVSDNSYTGVGLDRRGQNSVTIDGMECANWREVALKGQYKYKFTTVTEGRVYKNLGNSNFCRNPTGYTDFDDLDNNFAPFCLTHEKSLATLEGQGR